MQKPRSPFLRRIAELAPPAVRDRVIRKRRAKSYAEMDEDEQARFIDRQWAARAPWADRQVFA